MLKGFPEARILPQCRTFPKYSEPTGEGKEQKGKVVSGVHDRSPRDAVNSAGRRPQQAASLSPLARQRGRNSLQVARRARGKTGMLGRWLFVGEAMKCSEAPHQIHRVDAHHRTVIKQFTQSPEGNSVVRIIEGGH